MFEESDIAAHAAVMDSVSPVPKITTSKWPSSMMDGKLVEQERSRARRASYQLGANQSRGKTMRRLP